MRDGHTRQNHAAAVSALRIQNGDGGGGTHIDDDLREGIVVDARDGVHDEIAAELGGIIDVDAQAGFDAGADDERREMQVFVHRVAHGERDGRDDGRENRAVNRGDVCAVHIKRHFEHGGIFEHRCGGVCGDAFAENDLSIGTAADDNVGVADIDG